MSGDSDLSTCRLCEKIKLRKHVGTFDGKNKKYVDEHGKLWSGRKCPDCQRDKAKMHMRRLRLHAKTRADAQD